MLLIFLNLIWSEINNRQISDSRNRLPQICLLFIETLGTVVVHGWT